LAIEIALLVGLKLSGRSSRSGTSSISAEESLEELAVLAATAGATVADRSIQTRARADSATLIGSGKVDLLKQQVQFHDASVVMFDQELSPTQQRNLERALDVKVLDRRSTTLASSVCWQGLVKIT